MFLVRVFAALPLASFALLTHESATRILTQPQKPAQTTASAGTPIPLLTAEENAHISPDLRWALRPTIEPADTGPTSAHRAFLPRRARDLRGRSAKISSYLIIHILHLPPRGSLPGAVAGDIPRPPTRYRIFA
ncbi:hypothetical protein F4810DRAFT_503429 [Camillea tinctor]|nr:hypothetical protein F4810DRAFT_503429 [Camillea tinctor]